MMNYVLGSKLDELIATQYRIIELLQKAVEEEKPKEEKPKEKEAKKDAKPVE